MFFEDLVNFLKPNRVVKNFDTEILELNIVFENNFHEKSLGWISDKNMNRTIEIQKGNVIISELIFNSFKEELSKNVNWLIVENPRKAFANVIANFFVPKKKFGLIHNSAVLADSIKINKDTVIIGPNVVLEDNVEIGNNVEIQANTVVKKGTIIHSDVVIGSNCTIGGVGFGYEKEVNGDFQIIHHIGNVMISDNVEIGNNVCIDRAVIGSTFIGRNVKIDNLVHIAHGVKIDENSLIIANAMIGGSVEIGKNVWVSPSVSIRQKLKIEDGALVGMGSVVVKNVPKEDIVAGVPSKSIKAK
jgi:UDP-3-O-[3-hydroxymyristoyl] glucosamine N-acyltransferase